jgi:phosphatidylserine/phosphatidylglycerophosphate/cardiolipin synthase-like enzyme
MKDKLANELRAAGIHVYERDLSHRGASSPSVHNKYIVERNVSSGIALRVLTGSTNWTTTGLCTQLNNVLVIDRPTTANRFYEQWLRLTEAGDNMPAALKQENAKWIADGPVSVAFAATPDEEEFAPVLDLINGADVDGLFFLMFMPGQSPLLDAVLKRAEGEVGPYVRGVVSTVRASANGDIEESNGRVIRNGQEKNVRDSTLLPAGVPADNAPAWEREEFTTKMFFPAGLNAIVHSKVFAVSNSSGDCAVVTGSHNFSDAASAKNDENLVVVRGNKALFRAYAVHIQGVYDHYSWRAFLASGGEPNSLYDSLADWKPNGRRARDLKFWTR